MVSPCSFYSILSERNVTTLVYHNKYRVDANRTQEEVAEKVEITARFLMALENEEKRPSIVIHLRQYMRLNDRDKSVIRTAIQEMLNNR